jgi:tRNA-dihydrouridine synthase A
MLGLWNGTPGARRWRQVWSDHRRRDEPPQRVFDAAMRARERAAGLVAMPTP